MRTIADYRQLNDALFHAGLNSGSQYEWEDTPNRLHFYVIDRDVDAKGILSYTVGVRSLDGGGTEARSVGVAAGPNCSFTVSNTGKADDIYRLSVSAEGPGWSAQLRNALAAPKPGESQRVEVVLAKGTAPKAAITLRAQSESDPSRSATASCSAAR
jgi:hypothetical protein